MGETTAGGANGGGPYRIAAHFFASMPMLHLDNPETRSNWEGKGITPDVQVPERDGLSTAHRLALQRLVEQTQDPQALAVLKQALATVDNRR